MRLRVRTRLVSAHLARELCADLFERGRVRFADVADLDDVPAVVEADGIGDGVDGELGKLLTDLRLDLRISEPAADLSVLLAIVSSLKNKVLPSKLIVFGEVGLAGEIRPAPRGQERLKEAAKLGFTRAMIPEANKPRQAIADIEVLGVRRVEEAVERLRDLE